MRVGVEAGVQGVEVGVGMAVSIAVVVAAMMHKDAATSAARFERLIFRAFHFGNADAWCGFCDGMFMLTQSVETNGKA